ncbi:hypothetical protein [Sharpea azabuensis]|uniref:hypothetical protein n=1 Tax=Sharpea azabuensis TaxID=322505 RepID=UPI001569D8D0|nr:hypothetical protein [Sharpea azabuensis]
MFNWTAKCQSVTIYEQAEKYNVKMFDMRVRFKDGIPILAHGLVEYDLIDAWCMDDFLAEYAETHPKDEFYCRVMLENTFMSKDRYPKQIKAFKDFCKVLETNAPKNLHYVGGWRKDDFTNVYQFKTQQPDMHGSHASCSKHKIVQLWPWIYAKLHNKESHKRGTDKTVLMLDFIQIGYDKH